MRIENIVPPSDLRAPPADSKSPFGTEGLRGFSPYLINRVIRRYNSSVEAALRDTPVNVARLRVIAALVANGPQGITELSIFSVSEQSTTSRLVDQMEVEGLVTRRIDRHDQRARIVALTDAGRRAFDKGFPIMQAEEARMLDGFTSAEQALLRELLGRMLDNVRNTSI